MTKADVFIRFQWSSVDGGKRCEKKKKLLCVFKKQKTEVFENALVCTGPNQIFVLNSCGFPSHLDVGKGRR